MTDALKEAIEKKQRSAILIWGALTVGMGVYALIAGLVIIPFTASSKPADQQEIESLVYVIFAAAAVLATAAVLVYRAANTEEGMLKVMSRPIAKKEENLAPEEQQLLAVAQQISSNSFLATALCDGIAALGLVLGLLTNRADYVYVSSGLGILLSLLVMPRMSDAIELAETLQRGARR